jgi:hypothetical protein
VQAKATLIGFIAIVAIVNLGYFGVHTNIPVIDNVVTAFVRVMGAA